jgi:hypothetical protein
LDKEKGRLAGQPWFYFFSVVTSIQLRLLFEGCPHAFMALAKNEDQNSDFDSQQNEIHQGFLFNLF